MANNPSLWPRLVALTTMKNRRMHEMPLTVPMLSSKEQLSSSSDTLIITPFFCHSQRSLTSEASSSTLGHLLNTFNFLFLESCASLFHRKHHSSRLMQLFWQPYLKTTVICTQSHTRAKTMVKEWILTFATERCCILEDD